jgi:hypothetical protein
MAFPRSYSLFANLICFLMFNIGNAFSTPVDFNFEGALSNKEELLIVSLGTGYALSRQTETVWLRPFFPSIIKILAD